MSQFRILALDGGGILGLIEVVLLRRIERALEVDLAEGAHLMAGTSTGGLIALGLAHGLALDELVALYRSEGAAIFGKKPEYARKYPKSTLPLTKDAPYQNVELERALRKLLGDTALGRLGRSVVITALDLDPCSGDTVAPTVDCDDVQARRWRPHLFSNARRDGADDARPAWRVGMATSAVPTFFPIFDGFIDGGVVANNPSMAALAFSQDEASAFEPRPLLDDVRVLSVGTALLPFFVELDPLQSGGRQRGLEANDGGEQDDLGVSPPGREERLELFRQSLALLELTGEQEEELERDLEEMLDRDEGARGLGFTRGVEEVEPRKRAHKAYRRRDGDWGPFSWLVPDGLLMSAILTGGPALVDYQCRQLLQGRYHRLCARPSVSVPHMTDASEAALDRLEALADAVDMTATFAWVEEHWL